MKSFFAIFFVILSTKVCLGQNIDKKVVSELYSKTIENYFNALAVSETKDDRSISEFILISDSLKNNIPLTYKSFKLKIVKDKAQGIKEVEKIQGKSGAVFMISQKFNIDTLDISINRFGVSIKPTLQIRQWHLITRHVFWAADCGGTNGYIPTGRMLYSHLLHSWYYSSGEEIFAELKRSNHYL